jgi:CheY-like chemotaxis protein
MAKVLVVDDATDLCRAVRRMLEQAGHTAECAYDGRTAIDVMEADGFEAVILDYMMPDMTGLDVLAAMRASEHLRGLPAVLFTAFPDPALAGRARELGADGVVPKAGDFDLLLNWVSAAARRQQQPH